MKNIKVLLFIQLVIAFAFAFCSCSSKYTIVDFTIYETKTNKSIAYGEPQNNVENDFRDFKQYDLFNGSNDIGVIYRNKKIAGVVTFGKTSARLFKTSKGISIGSEKNDVLKEYGVPTHQEKIMCNYVFLRDGSNLQLLTNNQTITKSDLSNTYVIKFDFNTDETVKNIWMGDFNSIYNLQ